MYVCMYVLLIVYLVIWYDIWHDDDIRVSMSVCMYVL